MNRNQYDNNEKLFEFNNRTIAHLLNNIRKHVANYNNQLLISEIVVLDYLCASINSTYFFFKKVKINHNLSDKDIIEKDLTPILKAYSKEIEYLKIKTVTEKEMKVFMNLMQDNDFLNHIKYISDHRKTRLKNLMYYYCILSDKIMNYKQ